MGRVFAIMSGKGGVGKSTLAAALAEFYARKGEKTVLVDGDIGLRCADLLLGMQDRVTYDLGDAAEKNCELSQALTSHPQLPQLKLLAAPQLMSASDVKKKVMGRIITRLSEQSDILILDAPAGLGRGLKNLLGAAAEPVLVATLDMISLRDAERLSGILIQREEPRPVVVFNRADKALIRKGVMQEPEKAAMALELPLMGVIPESKKVYRALLEGKSPLSCADPKVIKAVEVIAARLLGADAPLPLYIKSPVTRFFNRREEI